jgi:tetratricopeptide (TPR) repeat protein
MRIAAWFIFFVPLVVLSARAGETITEPPVMVDARKAGVTVVQLMEQRLEKLAGADLPGIESWMKREGAKFAALDRAKPDDSWCLLDGDALTTHSANFWQLYYEVVPADPGLSMLHGGALLASGDASRALMVMRLAMHRNDLDENTRGIFKSLLQQCDKFPQPSHVLVREGISLHDKADYDRALTKYDEALKLWPLNGWAAYEKGLTLRERDGGEEAVAQLFAWSRRADPSQWAAWQGKAADVPGMMTMQRVVRPLWEKSLGSLGYVMSDKELEELASGWQEAKLDDLALATRQVLVTRNKRYLPADYPFISKSLRRLVPGKQAEATLSKLANGPLNAVQLYNAPVSGEVDEKKKGGPEVRGTQEEKKKSGPEVHATDRRR